MVDKTTPQSNNVALPSGILVVLAAASTSAQDACQIIFNDMQNRQARQQYGPFEVLLEYTVGQSLVGIWTTNLELANVATQKLCACEPLVSASLHYELARRLQCSALELEAGLEVAAHIRYELPIDEKRALEDLEHKQRITRETLKDVRCSLSLEEKEKLKQEEQNHKSTSHKAESILMYP